MQKESRFKKFFTSKIFLFFALLILIWVSICAVKAIYKSYRLRKEIENLKSEISKVEKGNKELDNLLQYLKNKDFLEKEVREKLNLKKEGESVVIVQPSSDLKDFNLDMASNQDSGFSSQADIRQDQSSKQASIEESNWKKWWNYFFEN